MIMMIDRDDDHDDDIFDDETDNGVDYVCLIVMLTKNNNVTIKRMKE